MAVAPMSTPATTKRSVRAATEPLATAEIAPGVYLVDNGKLGDDHEQYTVDAETGACTCADHQYNLPTEDGREYCKHSRRVMFERGEIDIEPLLATDLRIDPLLLESLEETDRTLLADGGLPPHLTRLSTITDGDVVHCQTCGGEGDSPDTVDHHDDCPDGGAE